MVNINIRTNKCNCLKVLIIYTMWLKCINKIKHGRIPKHRMNYILKTIETPVYIFEYHKCWRAYIRPFLSFTDYKKYRHCSNKICWALRCSSSRGEGRTGAVNIISAIRTRVRTHNCCIMDSFTDTNHKETCLFCPGPGWWGGGIMYTSYSDCQLSSRTVSLSPTEVAAGQYIP